jgi:hypothetical protein
MQQDQQEELRQQQLDEALKEADRYEILSSQEGWQSLLGFFEARVKGFVNEMLTNDTKKIEEFEAERMELVGMRKMIGKVSESVAFLNEYRRNQSKKAA